jgi:galactofuranosylgalactofuranosylrhamnosyl-N-acetylglucosaminyl-diphospho-decaprenol beta-1,5/1,6-galactofuranosyltransferase
MQYGMAATLLKAVEDFLAGPAILADGSVSAAAEIRALRARYPDTLRHAPAELAGSAANLMPIIEDPGAPWLTRLTRAKRLVYLLLGLNRGSAAVTAKDAKWWHVSQYRKVLVTDSAQDALRIRRYDPEVLIRLAREGAGLLTQLCRRGRAARDEWRGAMPQLTSRTNWERLFATCTDQRGSRNA